MEISSLSEPNSHPKMRSDLHNYDNVAKKGAHLNALCTDKHVLKKVCVVKKTAQCQYLARREGKVFKRYSTYKKSQAILVKSL